MAVNQLDAAFLSFSTTKHLNATGSLSQFHKCEVGHFLLRLKS